MNNDNNLQDRDMKQASIILLMLTVISSLHAGYRFEKVQEYWSSFQHASEECLSRLQEYGYTEITITSYPCSSYSSLYNKASFYPSCGDSEYSDEDEDEIDACISSEEEALDNMRRILRGSEPVRRRTW